MKITLSYQTWTTKTFTIPEKGKWARFFKAWLKDDDDRTNADWDILEKYDMYDFLSSQGVHADETEIGIVDFE